MKKFCIVLKLLGISFALFLVISHAGAGTCSAKVFQIGITQIAPHPALDAIRNGCIKGLEEAGFVEGKNLKIEFINAQGDMSLTKTIADKFVAARKDLIVTITTPSSQSVSVATKGTDIPVVFIAVTSPVLVGLVPNWEKPCSPGLRISGVSDFMPIKPQLELIKQIVPNGKKLGIVCNFGDDSNTKSVNEMRRLAPDYGLEIVEANVSTSADIQSAGASLAGRADIAWIPMCNTTVTGLEALVAMAEEKKIPLFVPDHESVDRGGIGALHFDNFALGKIGGEKAARVLMGEDVCQIPVSTWPPEALKGYHVNPGAAKRMGVTIPKAILDKASVTKK